MTPSSKAVKRASWRIVSRRGSHASQMSSASCSSYAAERREIARSRLPRASKRRAWRNLLIGEFGAKRSESAAILAAGVCFTARRQKFRDSAHHYRLTARLVQ